jgi:hypothetical protein
MASPNWLPFMRNQVRLCQWPNWLKTAVAFTTDMTANELALEQFDQ